MVLRGFKSQFYKANIYFLNKTGEVNDVQKIIIKQSGRHY